MRAGQQVGMVHLPRKLMVALWAALIGPWLLVGLLFVSQPRPGRDEGRIVGALRRHFWSQTRTDGGFVKRCRPGPWGDVEYTRIILEPPNEYVDLRNTSAAELRWVFEGSSRLEAEYQMLASGLTAEQCSAGTWDQTSEGTVFEPESSMVSGLDPQVRARLYGLLSQFDDNFAQANPYRFRGDSLEEWFEGSELLPATIALVRQHLYRRGTSLAFADASIVLPQLPDDDERRRLIKVLSRRTALMVKLCVNPQSDLPALDAYWSIGGRSKDIEPMLASLSRQPSGAKVDVVHLLPRFARAHIYTYPVPIADARDKPPDCFWSSLNFFRQIYDDSFATPEGAARGIEENYYEVVGPPQLGDLMLLELPAGGVIHSCVYIADDIVFTKNGTSMSTPWIFMALADVTAFYSDDSEVKVRVYRPKQRVG